MMNWRQSKQISRRLTELAHVPLMADLKYVFDQAMQAKGQLVELPWTHGDPKAQWCLTAKASPQGSEQPVTWALLRGDGSAPNYEWTYDTGDVAMIYTLLQAAFPDENFDTKLPAESSAVAAPRNPAPPPAPAPAPVAAAPGALAQAAGVSMPGPAQPGTSISGNYSPSRPVVSPDGERGALEGDLSKMQIENLVQSIVASRMTGRLAIHTKTGVGEIFFEEGQAVHASYQGCDGDKAAVELLTLQEGAFQFFSDQTIAKRSLQKNINSLLLEGAALLDYNRFLDSCELTVESYLFRNHQSISEQQFESMLSKAVPVNMALQKQIYMAIDNKSRFIEILRKIPLERVDWAPMMFNLITCGLVSLAGRPEQTQQKLKAISTQIDQSAIKSVMKHLVRNDSGLYTHSAFLYFIEQEQARYKSLNHPFSVVIIRAGVRNDDPASKEPDSLPPRALAELVARINKLKRPSDLLAHYEALNYALLLPFTQRQAAAAFARRLIEAIVTSPLTPEIDPSHIIGTIGLASAPEDAKDPATLLSMASNPKFTIGY